ncbi:TonB-dependent receptor [Vibrio sp. J1-1]|uniref:TonB-dependent receptor n=1 Tax=Vibrio sp. J1-1 TaxID=2912251 RepID=UPI001F2E4E11|nr:TonB-dependent receptor [Vibrio sp. J1-1]MCF7480877.1 TonB-dependent receptor [Vibrio sp. J1-1]
MNTQPILITLLVSTSAYVCAQDTQTVSEPNSTEVITVTGKYWPTSTEYVPASQTKIPADQLETPALSTTERISQFVSNTLVEQSSIQTRVVIRGQSSIDAGLNSPVGYILDDVSLPLGIKQAPTLLNSHGIELIKGAQGSYYGRNSQAGILIVESLTPQSGFNGWGQYSYLGTAGADDQEPGHQFQGGISGGNDSLTTNIALDYQTKESPYYNLYRQSNDENENLHLQGSLSYLMTPDTEVLYRAHWQEKDAGRATMRYLTGMAATDRFTVNQNTESDHDEKFQLHSLRVDHQLDTTTLTSITGYTDYEETFVMDPDCSPMPAISDTLSYLSDQMFSQEIRLSSADYNEIKWAIGGYLYKQDTLSDFTIGFTGIQRVTDNDQWGAAGFGHIQFPVTQNLTLTAGIRAEHIEQKGKQTGLGNFDQSIEDTEWLPKIVAEYKFNQDQSLYASWSTGYLPGGFNYGYSSNIDNFSYDPEHTLAYEAGHSASWAQGAVTTEFVLFYNKVSDKQVVDIQPGLVQEISNAAKADIYGLETQFDWRLNDQWSLAATLGLQQGETESPGVEKHDLPYTPDYTWSTSLDFAPTPQWLSSLQVRGSGEYFFDSTNLLEQDAHEIVDFSLRYLWDPVTMTLAVNNLFDEEVYSRSVNTMAGVLVEDTQPRTFSLTAQYKW